MTGDNQMEEEKHIYSRVIGARNNKWANTPLHNESKIKLTSTESEREKQGVAWGGTAGGGKTMSNMKRRKWIRMGYTEEGGDDIKEKMNILFLN